MDGGAALRALRVGAGLTIDGLAARSGVSARTIGGIERGRIRRPQDGTIGALAGGLRLGPAGGARLRAALHAESAAAGLPRSTPCFTGRTADLDWLAAAIGSGRPVQIAGLPGVGKTALALRAAARSAADFPHGVRLADLGGHRPPGPAEAARRVARALSGGTDAGGHGPRRRVLLIVDGVSDPGQVAALLPAAGPAVTVMTCAHRIPLPGVRSRVLAPLPADDSRLALDRMTGGTVPDRVVGDLARLCHGLPLALRAVANRLLTRGRWPVERIADRLMRPGRLLDELAAGDLSVRATFHRGCLQLPGPARHALRTLARDAPPAAALAELARCGWVPPPATGAYDVHPLLRAFAATI
ncbi:helix-turn-helix domain-containing protein [Catenuloplanes indicus]|uniref:Transcriptional regulator with XRE-family HTH domain n=1 Tax=Catenuloplanes indicus TaxID=137267 RepID=A0AAE3VWQ4_9ACTN|nr:helix-turn-helix transcriptional regulator [Catenuloplanes indicus]MDQ0364435.1 transcriptional regulator with XRE-family HTH domain [Catenuloplanes indicus]